MRTIESDALTANRICIGDRWNPSKITLKLMHAPTVRTRTGKIHSSEQHRDNSSLPLLGQSDSGYLSIYITMSLRDEKNVENLYQIEINNSLYGAGVVHPRYLWADRGRWYANINKHSMHSVFRLVVKSLATKTASEPLLCPTKMMIPLQISPLWRLMRHWYNIFVNDKAEIWWNGNFL